MIDIREINSIKFNTGIRFDYGEKAGLSLRKNIYTGIANFCVSLLQSVFLYPLNYRNITNCKEGSLIVYSSRNQLIALEPINSCLKKNNNHAIVSITQLPLFFSYCISLLYIPAFIKYYRKSTKDDKKIIGNEFNAFLRSYGDYKMFSRIFKKKKPKILIVANDHVSTLRAAIIAANDADVKTLYVQHAAITEKFPQLLTSYSFLDGLDSFQKYQKRGINSEKVFLIGGSRFDNIDKNKDLNRESIGVALTLKDNDECWHEVVNRLKENYLPSRIVIRPHPSMNLKRVINYCKEQKVSFSNPLLEDSFSFISSISFLVANETSIHLDSAIMHVPSVLCTCMSKKPFSDHYGLVKSSVLEHIECLNDLIPYIHNYNYKPADSFIRNYNASYNTHIEGHVSEIISNFIDSVVFNTVFVDERLQLTDNIYTIKTQYEQ